MQSFFLKQPVAAVFIRSPSGGITRNLKRPKSDRLLGGALLCLPVRHASAEISLSRVNGMSRSLTPSAL